MIPNVADFALDHDSDGYTCYRCPECWNWYAVPHNTIRDLIGAASKHARTAHARTEVNA